MHTFWSCNTGRPHVVGFFLKLTLSQRAFISYLDLSYSRNQFKTKVNSFFFCNCSSTFSRTPFCDLWNFSEIPQCWLMMTLQRNGTRVEDKAQMGFQLVWLNPRTNIRNIKKKRCLFVLFKLTELLLNSEQPWIWSFPAWEL